MAQRCNYRKNPGRFGEVDDDGGVERPPGRPSIDFPNARQAMTAGHLPAVNEYSSYGQIDPFLSQYVYPVPISDDDDMSSLGNDTVEAKIRAYKSSTRRNAARKEAMRDIELEPFQETTQAGEGAELRHWTGGAPPSPSFGRSAADANVVPVEPFRPENARNRKEGDSQKKNIPARGTEGNEGEGKKVRKKKKKKRKTVESAPGAKKASRPGQSATKTGSDIPADGLACSKDPSSSSMMEGANVEKRRLKKIRKAPASPPPEQKQPPPQEAGTNKADATRSARSRSCDRDLDRATRRSGKNQDSSRRRRDKSWSKDESADRREAFDIAAHSTNPSAIERRAQQVRGRGPKPASRTSNNVDSRTNQHPPGLEGTTKSELRFRPKGQHMVDTVLLHDDSVTHANAKTTGMSLEMAIASKPKDRENDNVAKKGPAYMLKRLWGSGSRGRDGAL